MNAFIEVSHFIIHTFFFLYMAVVIIRFLLQVARADFYNPFSQTIMKLTNPFLLPIRRVTPGFRGFDIASLLLALIVEVVAFFLLVFIYGETAVLNDPLTIFVWLTAGVFWLCLRVYFWAMMILFISNIFIMLTQNHSLMPIYQFVSTFCEPILGPIRRKIPPVGMLDLSLFMAVCVIYIIGIFVKYLGVNAKLVIAF